MKVIPPEFAKFFWDTDFSSIDPDSNHNYIITRLYRLGDEASWRWIKTNYSQSQIRACVRNNRELSPKDHNFFKLVFSS